MKKIEIKLIGADTLVKQDFAMINGVAEINEYGETKIKHDDFLSGYSFESLLDGAKMCANGIWHTIKGFGIMSMWAVVVIIQGIKLMWQKAFGDKK